MKALQNASRFRFQKGVLFALATTLVITGCDNVWQTAYIASNTVVGVNAAVSGSRQTGALIIGYDRDFATVIPTYVNNATGRREVMRVRGCSGMKTEGINLVRYADVIATGQYARNPAAAGEKDIKMLEECGNFVGIDEPEQ